MASPDPDPDRSSSAAAPVAPAPPSLRSPRSRVARLWRIVTSPFYRYRHAKLIHGVRVGLAMLVSILATTGINIPNGVWASVTLLVVIGGLQHQGNIRKKAAERAAGTLLGATIGLGLIVQGHLVGSLPLTYLLMSVIAGICSWYAIGKAGYVALLTAITMVIVAGHGHNAIDVGLWRTANVLIGIVIALAFSFALPLYATYSWRYLLADNLRECARIYTRMVGAGADSAGTAALSADEQTRTFLRLGTRLVQLRALIPSVAKEIDVPQSTLEDIQRLHRSMLSALEMMTTGTLTHVDAAARAAFAQQCGPQWHRVRGVLLGTARALRFAGTTRFRMPERPLARDTVGSTPIDPATNLPADPQPDLPADLQGPYWLGLRLAEQVEQLRALLAQTEAHWNIDGHTKPSAPAPPQ
ncbi:FUSC family protein [Paraburkholderia acidicola]|uniref:FUSC family protein n=1 Tax=Paraburkholderia acidicola TaxID=1912599 RepID=A0ABV1LQY1_9BURK